MEEVRKEKVVLQDEVIQKIKVIILGWRARKGKVSLPEDIIACNSHLVVKSSLANVLRIFGLISPISVKSPILGIGRIYWANCALTAVMKNACCSFKRRECGDVVIGK